LLDGRNLTADQLEFVDLMIDHVTARVHDFDSNGVARASIAPHASSAHFRSA
jgi:hypothetical protein